MKCGWGSTHQRKAGEAALTGENTLLFIIAGTIVLLCCWLAWQYSASTDDEARTYAARALERLAVAHDASYFAANLSPVARPGYPASQQKYVMASLTSLGVPVGPIKLEGAVTFGSDPGAQDPKGHFESHIIYPVADARIYLDVARRGGFWQIDSFALEWQNKPARASVPSP